MKLVTTNITILMDQMAFLFNITKFHISLTGMMIINTHIHIHIHTQIPLTDSNALFPD